MATFYTVYVLVCAFPTVEIDLYILCCWLVVHAFLVVVSTVYAVSACILYRWCLYAVGVSVHGYILGC